MDNAQHCIITYLIEGRRFESSFLETTSFSVECLVSLEHRVYSYIKRINNKTLVHLTTS